MSYMAALKPDKSVLGVAMDAVRSGQIESLNKGTAMTKEKSDLNFKNVYEAFDEFQARFLIDRKSIFFNNNDDEVLTKEALTYLKDNFIENGYEGDASFREKIQHQLVDEPKVSADDEVRQKAVEILATAAWLWRLPARVVNDRAASVNEVLGILGDINKIPDNNHFLVSKFEGIASVGTYYNTNKPFELAYIISFFDEYLKVESNPDPIKILSEMSENSTEATQKIKITKDFSYQDKEKKKEPKLNGLNKDPQNKSVSIHNALLHFFKPEKFEPILSRNHKESIDKVFSDLFDIPKKGSVDQRIEEIKSKIIKELHEPLNGGFYDERIKNIWFGGLDFEAKNIILHGAPGTGKTYITTETIKAKKILEKNVEYELVQFHPSYGYEDFIEGIKPTGMTKGQMKFELKNGIFKQMCIDAFKNLVDVAQNNAELKTYYFIADEVNRAELSRVFGELLLCLEDDKRLRIEGGKVVGTMIKTQSSNLWTENDVVVCIDDEGKPVVATEDNKDNWYFGVPENIYFIGTMNDIDRSVDSFDMALRRRFVWKKYRCDYDVVLEKYSEAENVDKYIEACEALNNHIVKDFGLSDSYELGHSYFMQAKSLNNTELKRVWDERISPILREYLRAQFADAEIDKKLKDAQKTFQL